jgi:hypothetical protein
MTLAAMITCVALLNGTILASTRMPFAMAEDGYLPHVLTGVHRRYGTPWIAIIASAVVYGLLAVHSLVQLIVIYNWLRVATTVLTVLASVCHSWRTEGIDLLHCGGRADERCRSARQRSLWGAMGAGSAGAGAGGLLGIAEKSGWWLISTCQGIWPDTRWFRNNA